MKRNDIRAKRERTKRGCIFLPIQHKAGHRARSDFVPSISAIPCRETKSYTIPIFPGSVCVSRLCSLKANDKPARPPSPIPPPFPVRVFMKRQSVHARVHMSSRSFVPSKRSQRNGMRNGRIMRHIAGSVLPRAPTCSRTGKALSIDDKGRRGRRGGIVSTMSDAWQLSFACKDGSRLIGPGYYRNYTRDSMWFHEKLWKRRWVAGEGKWKTKRSTPGQSLVINILERID